MSEKKKLNMLEQITSYKCTSKRIDINGWRFSHKRTVELA